MIVFKPSSVWYFCYSNLNRLRNRIFLYESKKVMDIRLHKGMVSYFYYEIFT